MTKKHFTEIADIIKNSKDQENLIENFILYFQKENPRFDVKKFKEGLTK